MNHILYSLFSVGIKYGTISLCAYSVFYTALPQKPSPKRNAAVIGCILLYAVGLSLFRDRIHPFQATVTLAVFTLIVCAVLKIRLKEAAALSLLSLSGSFAAYFVATMTGAAVMGSINQLFFPEIDLHKELMQGNVLFHMLSFLPISLLQILLLVHFLRSRRIRKGLAAISKYGDSAAGLYISIMLMAAMTGFTYLSVRFPTGQYTEIMVPLVFLCIFTLIFWIRHEIKAVYLLRQRDAERERMQQSLTDARQQKEALQEDNRRLADIIRKDGSLLPAMVASARECIAQMESAEKDKPTLLETALQLEEIHDERMAALAQYEQHSGTSSKENLPSP